MLAARCKWSPGNAAGYQGVAAGETAFGKVEMMKPGVEGSAEFSDDGRCRFSLKRLWDKKRGLVLYTGLNPSKAGADNDDMTVTKGMGFANLKFKMGGTLHGNAFPFISTNPKDLAKCTEAEIRKNDRRLLEMAGEASVVVLAWGSYPKFKARFDEVAKLLMPFRPICLGRTKDGYPHHISRIAYTTPIEAWS